MQDLLKQELLHEGKSKSIYNTNIENKFIMHFKDDATAFNGVKKESLKDKGLVNNYFNAFIMEKLEEADIKTHFIKSLNKNESLVKSLTMLPIECVVRNYAAGGICKRLGLKNRQKFNTPIFEFFYKNDELGDPMINESHIQTFNWASSSQIIDMKKLTFKVNTLLSKLFANADIILVDYKLEFGLSNGDIILGDEFTPDGCRLWDKDTLKVMDKDRFRQDMGDVIKTYKEVAKRIGVPEII